MFSKQTVIVLGAGASAPFGFPLGRDLRQSIISDIRSLEEKSHNIEYLGNFLPPTSAQNAYLFKKHGVSELISYVRSPLAQEYLPAEFQSKPIIDQFFEFSRDFERQTHDTIDRFIATNPRHRLIGKLLLAHQIMLNMYEH